MGKNQFLKSSFHSNNQPRNPHKPYQTFLIGQTGWRQPNFGAKQQMMNQNQFFPLPNNNNNNNNPLTINLDSSKSFIQTPIIVELFFPSQKIQFWAIPTILLLLSFPIWPSPLPPPPVVVIGKRLMEINVVIPITTSRKMVIWSPGKWIWAAREKLLQVIMRIVITILTTLPLRMVTGKLEGAGRRICTGGSLMLFKCLVVHKVSDKGLSFLFFQFGYEISSF